MKKRNEVRSYTDDVGDTIHVRGEGAGREYSLVPSFENYWTEDDCIEERVCRFRVRFLPSAGAVSYETRHLLAQDNAEAVFLVRESSPNGFYKLLEVREY